MAGEVAGDGLPFLGSLMSLVSHGEIRYEGLLADVNMNTSTIALSNGERGQIVNGRSMLRQGPCEQPDRAPFKMLHERAPSRRPVR
jgi:hypothetical protein